MRSIKIICTIGPKSLNKNFLIFSKKNINLLRLNMSHLEVEELQKCINFIRKYSNVPICIDTEGAQIRTKTQKEKNFNVGKKFKIYREGSNLKLYPQNVFFKLKKNDILNIGFNNLIVKILKKTRNFFIVKTLSSGKFENNKGVHLVNRKIKLDYLTSKDLEAIKIGKKLNINYFALSFTNSKNDIIKFNKILQNENKIFKIETRNAVLKFKSLLKNGSKFLIDRGDLSKEVKLENIPIIQRELFKVKKKFRSKELYVATNLLESMIEKNYPHRGEANDIYNLIELGADGLVLAAETAIGNYPKSTVLFLKKMINAFKKTN